jgi:fatty acyl-CoA reductase
LATSADQQVTATAPSNQFSQVWKSSGCETRETGLGGGTIMDSQIMGVQDFYRGRSVFVTGATGFLGKATVEKLLRSCHYVKNVYVLIRPKAGSDARSRLTELVDNSLYDTLRTENPEILSKIIPIAGDITLPELGIAEDDQKLLCEEISVVFHSAATVKFDEKLKVSINVNLNGTKRLIELCKRMKKLVALVHVSTAYANCERDEINEIIYPPPADPHKLVQSVEWMNDDIINTITPELIGNKPNTYTYTKALAEHLLSEESGVLPICIVRPSIVTATWKEPVAGWVDNVNGPTGLIAACGKGVLRTLLCHRNKVADLIPLDFPVNLIISAAWYTATARPNSIIVYNCCSGAQNPLLWGDLERWGYAHLINNPLNDVLWYPGGSFKSNRIWNNINDFFVHYVPAYLMDVAARLSGKKPVMLRVYQKLTKATTSLQFFTTHQWHFTTDNMMELYDKLSPEDQKLFNFNVKEVNWPNYIGKYCLGMRKYVLKEDLSTLPAARKHMRKMYWVHKITQFFLILLFWRAIMFRSETARQLWSFMFGMVLRMSRMLPIGEAV